MKSYKTTIAGCLAAACIAAKPILDGSGYHFDTKTIAELTFAVVLAVALSLAKDDDAK